MTPDLILALVALINSIGGVVALIIHALRVPYRESSAKEAQHEVEAHAELVKAANGARAAQKIATAPKIGAVRGVDTLIPPPRQ